MAVEIKEARLGLLFSEEVSAMLWAITKAKKIGPYELLNNAIKIMYNNYQTKELN